MYKAYQVYTMYKAYNVSSVIYGPMYTPNFVHEVYDMYRPFTPSINNVQSV